MLQELDERPSKDVWLRELQKHWKIQAIPAGVGCLSLNLDEFLTSTDRESQIRALAEKALPKLMNRGPALKLAELNAMDFKGVEFSQDLPIQFVTTIGALFIRLLAGELKTTASSKIDYWYKP